ncbi:hypothetical protein AB0O91_21815 [Kitasatospora sp. NPDC089797]|uniref:hypothetical protein n=1 Tax=Kitasatospora sp. NPDC089797 TaxID=3155298 RepID=UPI0034483EDF
MDALTLADVEAALAAGADDYLADSPHARRLGYRITLAGHTHTGTTTVYGRLDDDQAAAFLARLHQPAGALPATAQLDLTPPA